MIIRPKFENPAEWVKAKYDQQEEEWFSFFLKAASRGVRCDLPWSNQYDVYVWPDDFWDFFELKEIEKMKIDFMFRKGQRVGYNLATFRNSDGNAVVQINRRGPCHHCNHHRWHSIQTTTCPECGYTPVVIPF